MRVILILFVFCCTTVHAQLHRKPVVLNMTSINQETGLSRYHSCIQLMQQAGLSYDTTSFIDTAVNYPIIITASRILDTSLSAGQRLQLQNYVLSGGVLISSSLRDTNLYSLFGINQIQSDDSLLMITWDTVNFPQYFDLVDDSLEVTVSIGDSSFTNFVTRAYTPTTAQSLAVYEDGRCALTKNNFGSGTSYLFGPDFRDIILRPQLNMDLEAQRVYSNGFEVSTDVFVFVMRNIIRQHIPNTIYKYTVPGNSTSALLITHDVDSYSSIDTMHYFSVWEESLGISAQYNITTRYLNDDWMYDFYNGNESRIDSLVKHGHILGSHSVGHLPDFGDEIVFPYGMLGNTMVTYTPLYISGVTSGGTVLGELEVSKDILESTYGATIRSFRAGHLCYPDSLIMGLNATGYEFNSTNSANDILTAFPFFPYDRRSFSGNHNGVLEIPMTISDVFKDDPIADTNSTLKVHIWLTQIEKYNRNNAPVNLLIHPNRMFKLTAMQNLLDSIPETMCIYPFQYYGEFWRHRDSLQFTSTISNDTLYINCLTDYKNDAQSFVIDHLGLDSVLFFDADGSPLNFASLSYSATQRLYYRQSFITNSPEQKEFQNEISVYPNPSTGLITIRSQQEFKNSTLEIRDITGKTLLVRNIPESNSCQLNLNEITTESGILFLTISSPTTKVSRKLVYIR